nr:translation initiation factor IF-2-like [Anser cygnoides]
MRVKPATDTGILIEGSRKDSFGALRLRDPRYRSHRSAAGGETSRWRPAQPLPPQGSPSLGVTPPGGKRRAPLPDAAAAPVPGPATPAQRPAAHATPPVLVSPAGGVERSRRGRRAAKRGHAASAGPAANYRPRCLVRSLQTETPLETPEQGAASPGGERGERRGAATTGSAPCSSPRFPFGMWPHPPREVLFERSRQQHGVGLEFLPCRTCPGPGWGHVRLRGCPPHAAPLSRLGSAPLLPHY